MLNIEEILKMSKEMGINISNDTSRKHYILNEKGKKIEFTTDMIMEKKEERTINKIKVKVFNNKKPRGYSNSYNLSNYIEAYGQRQVSLNNSMVNAA